MRINQDTLLDIARDTADRYVRNVPGLVTVYLCGSVLEGDFVLGGTLDIDLVCIHLDQVSPEREIVRLTDNVHLDIAHHAQKTYDQPRLLRDHAWLGPTVFSCKPLYDPRHYFDFIQASVRGQFLRPDHVLERARTQLAHARQIWFSYSSFNQLPSEKDIAIYLKAVEKAANALALLNGPALTDRRFLVNFPGRADLLGKPGLAAGLIGLLGGAQANESMLRDCLPEWKKAIQSIPDPQKNPRLHPDRFLYYQCGLEALLASSEPRNSLWPLLSTWSRAAGLQPAGSEIQEEWLRFCQSLELVGDSFRQRISALDSFLDAAEDTLDDWARSSGA